MAVRVERLRPDAVESWAPGRVTFVGDHTDYNFGLSLATTLPRGTRVRISVRSGPDEFLNSRSAPSGWESYPAACLTLLRDTGVDLPAVRIEVRGDLPIGMGLSSSASLISATLAGLYGLAGVDRSPDLLALDAQRVENIHLGVPTGTLDQEVIVKSPDDAVVCMDFGRGAVTSCARASLPGNQFLIIDTGVTRQLSAANYGTRRSECREALDSLMGDHDRNAWLRFRERSWAEIESLARRRSLPERLVPRLAHVWSENERVPRMMVALNAGDLSTIADLINQSHESLRDDFEVSTSAVERARAAILSQTGVHAARMVGAGFGGCLLVLAAEGTAIADHPTFAL